MPEPGLTVMWDVFAAHRAEPVTKIVTVEGIQLVFVPGFQTLSWQPLECRIFGNLKEKRESAVQHRSASTESSDTRLSLGSHMPLEKLERNHPRSHQTLSRFRI
jgi:hypothetical protein